MKGAKETTTVVKRGLNLRRAGHSRGHPLQLEEGLAVAGRGGAYDVTPFAGPVLLRAGG